jgi:predicted Fe-Mo cluster-binding NifX family protein
MRIAVCSDDGATVAAHFGRCGTFLIYDVRGAEFHKAETRMNEHSARSRGCSGNHGSQGHEQHSHSGLISVIADCRAAVAGSAGKRIIEDLKPLGIRLFVAAAGCSAELAVKRLVTGELPTADDNGCGRGHQSISE